MQLKICDFGLAIDMREERAVTRAGVHELQKMLRNCHNALQSMQACLSPTALFSLDISSPGPQRFPLSRLPSSVLLCFTTLPTRDARVHGPGGPRLPLQEQARGEQGEAGSLLLVDR